MLARSRLRPPGPRALRRRLWVSSARGLVWSMNWLRGEEPKNSLMAAVTGRMLMRDWGGDHVQVLNGHPLPDHALHAGKADAELVLQQLAHAPQPTVAQVVDVVLHRQALGQGVHIS